ncbi:hypothetical protein D9757_004329 [Collybiopsis confluens]|uniref:Mitochondrial import inner membrane translocase subunit TIM16 n=1 Tax=Collybiopsis confluens TaxID=2823264 RepID=A0A8H5MCX6_9AGAR|nr:hypothetical protein D9757_004329 [Collybiopsis confluens]
MCWTVKKVGYTAYRIIIESSSSSTPALGLLANTGDIETTRAALATSKADSFALPFSSLCSGIEEVTCWQLLSAMSSPRAIIQIVITGSRILGKAFLEAGRQAAKNARSPAQGAVGSDVAGVGNANSGSITDQLTRQHRMTLDEAHLVLNHYEHLFKANAPPLQPQKPATPSPRTKSAAPHHSHYLQSKVVRARERIEAENKVAVETEQKSSDSSSHPPPPPSTPGSS